MRFWKETNRLYSNEYIQQCCSNVSTTSEAYSYILYRRKNWLNPNSPRSSAHWEFYIPSLYIVWNGGLFKNIIKIEKSVLKYWLFKRHVDTCQVRYTRKLYKSSHEEMLPTQLHTHSSPFQKIFAYLLPELNKALFTCFTLNIKQFLAQRFYSRLPTISNYFAFSTRSRSINFPKDVWSFLCGHDILFLSFTRETLKFHSRSRQQNNFISWIPLLFLYIVWIL